MTVKEMSQKAQVGETFIRNLLRAGKVNFEELPHRGKQTKLNITDTPEQVAAAAAAAGYGGYRPRQTSTSTVRRTPTTNRRHVELPEKRSLFTAEDVAGIVGKSVNTVYNHIKKLNIEQLQNGKKRYMLRPDAQRILDVLAPPPPVEVEPAVTPADAMRSNMVLTRIDDLEAKVDNLTAVLKSMTVRIAALPIEFRDAVVALLK
jgi:hypothetical protein